MSDQEWQDDAPDIAQQVQRWLRGITISGDELDAEVLPPPSGPPRRMPQGWSDRMAADCTALIERHQRTPYRPGELVLLDHRLHVVQFADRDGVRTVPVVGVRKVPL